MANMGIDSLRANLTTPARTYLWEVVVPVPVGGGGTETFQIRAQSSQIPSVSSGSTNIPYKATAGIEVAGRKQYEHTWSCDFLESEDGATYDALYAWTQQITHDVAGVGVGDPLYKTDCYLALLSVDGSTFKRYKLKGCWIQNIGSVALAYNTDGVITFNVTFRFDSFEVVS